MVDAERVQSMLRRLSGDLADLDAEDPSRLVDDARVIIALGELDDLRLFIRAVETILADRNAD